jgi:hypothetical protein
LDRGNIWKRLISRAVRLTAFVATIFLASCASPRARFLWPVAAATAQVDGFRNIRTYADADQKLLATMKRRKDVKIILFNGSIIHGF